LPGPIGNVLPIAPVPVLAGPVAADLNDAVVTGGR